MGEYLYKVIDSNGKKIYCEYRLDKIKEYWEREKKQGYKMYAYTKDLRPKSFLMDWC